MFSGIVEEKAQAKKLTMTSHGYRLTVESETASKGSKVGDSVSVNGVCLTVVEVRGRDISFDVMEETLRRTNLAQAAIKKKVNLERALKVGDRVSGHFVTGHVDCVGKIRAVAKRPNNYVIVIELPKDKMAYVADKGSVAVDGASLTVAGIEGNSIKIYLIPLTIRATNLGSKRAGDSVNIEFDILGKYSLRDKPSEKDRVSTAFLKEHGFL